MVRNSWVTVVLAVMLSMPCAWAAGTVQEERHELMEGAKDAAKSIGGMLKGELDFDAATAMENFQAWAEVAAQAGDLFPEGSETGYDTEAKATIWSDRAGFNQRLDDFSMAVNSGIEASPQSLEELKAAAGPVFKTCKSCHEGYRVEKEN